MDHSRSDAADDKSELARDRKTGKTVDYLTVTWATLRSCPEEADFSRGSCPASYRHVAARILLVKELVLATLPRRLYLNLYRYNYKRTQPESFAWLQEIRNGVTADGYSLQPFDATKSIFVHIPKCAGVSIGSALYGNLAGGHTTLRGYMAVFEPRLLLEYFKFTIVRNPWDRVVSAYHYLKNGGMNERDQSWSAKHLSGYVDFGDFVRRWLTRENVFKGIHFVPQLHFIVDPHDRVRMDYIGRLETLPSDFAHITNRLGITAALPFKNRGRREADYRNYYDEETKAIVAFVYQDDIRLLGYEF